MVLVSVNSFVSKYYLISHGSCCLCSAHLLPIPSLPKTANHNVLWFLTHTFLSSTIPTANKLLQFATTKKKENSCQIDDCVLQFYLETIATDTWDVGNAASLSVVVVFNAETYQFWWHVWNGRFIFISNMISSSLPVSASCTIRLGSL